MKKNSKGISVISEGRVETLSLAAAKSRKDISAALKFPSGVRVPERFGGEAGAAFLFAEGKKSGLTLEVAGKLPQTLLFFFKEGCKASVFLRNCFSGNSHLSVGIFASPRAEVQFCMVQKNSPGADCGIDMAARLGEMAQLKLLTSNLGGEKQRNGVVILQEGRGSRCWHFEASLAKGSQQLFKESEHLHLAPGTYSRSVFNYATAGSAQVNVDGKVAIERSAPGADTHLLAKSLLLSEKSVSHVVPQLFVRNSDVQAGHGTAMAPLSEEELFYLRSRGIGENESRRLVLQGFLSGLLSKSEMDARLLSGLRTELDAAALLIYPRD